ncbi:site-specific integrase [Rhizosphaericola mali]|uniref:Site-specific integrase n=1 Tax=Rhizosphaericola mali TaxID=2545455 RepID=A0A5P2GDG9_9BACT|nr:site-specific integrase [Rhizosphaericola mali]QES89651.1 site-specific integrase [Rhizosphaericola mali]
MAQEQLIPLYYLSRKKERKDGKCPIWVRIRINGERKDFSTGLFVFPDHWNNELKLVTGGAKSLSVPANNALSQMTREISNLYILLCIQEKYVTAEMVVKAYKPEPKLKAEKDLKEELKDFELEQHIIDLTKRSAIHFKKCKKAEIYVSELSREYHFSVLDKEQNTIRQEIEKIEERSNKYFNSVQKDTITIQDVINEFLLQFLRKVMAGTRKFSTYLKWLDTKQKLLNFTAYHLKRSSITLTEIKLKFGEKLYDYLTVVAACGNNNTMKHIKNFKQVLDRAVTSEWINVNPLKSYKCTYKEPEPEAVFMDDIQKLINADNLNSSEEMAKDAFLVETFTGYAYAELAALKMTNLIIGIDGKQWLSIERGKTQRNETVPVMKIVSDIICKYEIHPKRMNYSFLFPVFSVQYYNRLLKGIANKVGINHDLHSHVGRHTFATTILLDNDVPLATVSKMLGHHSVRITERYAKVSKKNIGKHVERVENLLFKFQFLN